MKVLLVDNIRLLTNDLGTRVLRVQQNTEQQNNRIMKEEMGEKNLQRGQENEKGTQDEMEGLSIL